MSRQIIRVPHRAKKVYFLQVYDLSLSCFSHSLSLSSSTLSFPLLSPHSFSTYSLTPPPSRSHSLRPLSLLPLSPLFYFLSPHSLSLTPPPHPKCIHSSNFLTTTLFPLSPPYSLNPPSLLLPFSPRLLMP